MVIDLAIEYDPKAFIPRKTHRLIARRKVYDAQATVNQDAGDRVSIRNLLSSAAKARRFSSSGDDKKALPVRPSMGKEVCKDPSTPPRFSDLAATTSPSSSDSTHRSNYPLKNERTASAT